MNVPRRAWRRALAVTLVGVAFVAFVAAHAAGDGPCPPGANAVSVDACAADPFLSDDATELVP